MAKKLYEEENIRAIAEAIRTKSPEYTRDRVFLVRDMPEGISNVYDEGYNDGYTQGYDDGASGGGSGELHHLLLEQIQSQEIVYISKYMYCYPVNIYGKSIDYDMTFDDYVDREYSSISSNPLTYSVDNYTDFYLYLYIRATDTGNDEGMLAEIIVPPNWNNSADFVSQVGMGNPVEWKIEIIGARFAVDEI